MNDEESAALREMIEFENENTHLDFKQSDYINKENLLKDIMSMANTTYNRNSYIIIGVKAKPGVRNEIIGLERIRDQAEFENLIQENIEPVVSFQYYGFLYKDKQLGVIEVLNNLNPPYMMKKNYESLKSGDMWIRKGSRQSRVTREDLDRIILQREKHILPNNIFFGYDEGFARKAQYSVSRVNKDKAPSSKRKKRYEDLLEKLSDYLVNGNNTPKANSPTNPGLTRLAPLLNAKYGDYNADKKAIMVGFNEFNLPVYCTKEELLKLINDCPKTFYENDYYYYYEENSVKQNFYILNNSSVFLEDVEIKLWFSKLAFLVADRIPEKPKASGIFALLQQKPQLNNIVMYPAVKEHKDSFVVETSFNQVRHKEITQLFAKRLRVLIRNDIEGEYPIPYQISAKNLSHPLKGELTAIIGRVGSKDNLQQTEEA